MTDATTIDASDMVDVTNRLSDILRMEISMIQDMKLAQLHTLQEEKLKLTSVLEGYKDVLKNNPHIVRSIPEYTMNAMRKAATDFESLVAEDELQIKKARKVHSIVMDAIKKAVMKHISAGNGYNRNGEIDYGKKKVYPTQPISVNESI